MASLVNKYDVSRFFGFSKGDEKEFLDDDIAESMSLNEITFRDDINAMIKKAGEGVIWPSTGEENESKIPDMTVVTIRDSFSSLLSVAPEQEKSLSERQIDYSITGRGYDNDNPLREMAKGDKPVQIIVNMVQEDSFTNPNSYGLGPAGIKLIRDLTDQTDFTGKIVKTRSSFGGEIESDVALSLLPVLILLYIRFPMAYAFDSNLCRFLCDVRQKDKQEISDKDRLSFLTKHAQSAIPTLSTDSKAMGRCFRALLASVRGENIDKDPCVFGQGPDMILYTRVLNSCYNNLNSVFADYQSPTNYEKLKLTPADISIANKACARVLTEFRAMSPLLFIATLNYSNILDELSFNIERHIQTKCSPLDSGKIRQSAVTDCKNAEWIHLCSIEDVWSPLNPIGIEGTKALKMREAEGA
jgi:hypothetical protein